MTPRFRFAGPLAFALLAAPAAIADVRMDPLAGADIVEMITLPTSGLKAVQLGDGRMLLLTVEGRYVVAGRIYDTRLGREVDGFADLRRSIDTVGAELIDRLDVDAMAPIRLGTGAHRLLVFVDPLCPACHRLLGELRAFTADLTVLLLPVPADDRSGDLVARLHCAGDPDLAARALFEAVDPEDAWQRIHRLAQLEDAACDRAPLVNRLAAAHLLDVRQVPFLIAADGRISRGAPPDLHAFLVGG